MEDVGKFYIYLVYFMAICYILWQLGMYIYVMVIWNIFPVSVCCTEKNPATLTETRSVDFDQWTTQKVPQISNFTRGIHIIELPEFSWGARKINQNMYSSSNTNTDLWTSKI
jgi:hypothetical protein